MGCLQSKEIVDKVGNGEAGTGGSMMNKDGDSIVVKSIGGETPNHTTLSSGGVAAVPSSPLGPEEVDGEIFYDAIQSFSMAIASMRYAPAASMMARESVLRTVLLETEAETKSPVQRREEEVVIKSTTTTTAITANNNVMTTKRDSVAIVKENLMEKDGNMTTDSSSTPKHGYPGELTPEELEACLDFRRRLKEHPRPELKEMVAAYHPQEDEAFALCRFLRSRDFDPTAVISMLEGQNAADIWSEAKRQNFYADFDDVYGCPVPIFMSLFPVVVSGVAKNGATVFYFKTGEMNIDAIECIADLPELVPAVWDLLHNKGRLSMERESKTHDTSQVTILSERIILVDMKNYPSALFSSRGVEWMKNSASCTACFPETMNRTYLVNVPRTFSIVWALVKIFLEARTLAKIGFFANADKATQDLEKFVDSDELLRDYGGSGPSYNDVLAAQQKELGNGCTRFVIEHVVVTKRESQFDFVVNNDEKIHSIVVYTKSDYPAEFYVKKKTGSSHATVIESTNVGRETKTGQGKSNHYRVELNLTTCEELLTGGQYFVFANGSRSVKDHFLVAVSLSPF